MSNKAELRCMSSCSLKDVFSIGASLLVPLVLGIFTIITSNNQQSEMARQKSLDDSVQKQQWEIENNRNEQTVSLNREKHRNELLATYMRDMAELLKSNNFLFTNESRSGGLIRAKTLHVVSQLDATGNLRVIRFLYESFLLTNMYESNAVDVSTALLVNMDKAIFETTTKVGRIFLTGVIFENCSFNSLRVKNIDLESAILRNIDFSTTKSENPDNFESFKDISEFSDWNMIYVNFAYASMQTVRFDFNRLNSINFTRAKLKDVQIIHGHIRYSEFTSSLMLNVDFSYSLLFSVNFSQAQLKNVSFAHSMLYNVHFSQTKLVNVDFSSAILFNVTFDNADSEKANFMYSSLSK